MKSAILLVGMGCALSACKKEKKLECIEVAERVKKWEEVSGDDMGVSAMVLDSCDKDDWSQAYRRCIVKAFGGADPLSKIGACEDSSRTPEPSSGGSKQARKAKTSEASQMLKRMSDGARAYYMETHVPGTVDSLDFAPLDKQFPDSAGPTPPLGECCKEGREKCLPNSAGWDEPGWLALNFGVFDPHYYSYQFVRNGDEFTAFAFGDLDCDMEYSTFAIFGQVIDGEVNTTGSIYKVNALE